MSVIRVGDMAPDFTSLAQNGTRFSLADDGGKRAIVLSFYPKDKSPVCTEEVCSF